MDFQRTNRTIRSLEKKDSLTLEESLGLMTDMLADVQSMTGGSPDQLDTGDLRAAVTSLSMIGRALLQVKKTKSEEFGTAADRKKRLDKIYDEIETTCQEMENAGEQIEEYSLRQRELEEKRVLLSEKARKAEGIQSDCQHIREEIEKLSTVDLNELNQEKEQQQLELDRAKERFQEEYNELERLKDIARMLGDDIADKEKESTDLRQTVAVQREKLQKTEEECLHYQEELDRINGTQETSAARAEGLKQKYEEAQSRMQTIASEELPELNEKLQQAEQALREQQERCHELQQQITEKEQSVALGQQELQRQMQEAEKQEAALAHLQNEKETVQSDVAEKTSQCEELDREIKRLQAELKAAEDLSQAHREEIARYRDITIPASMIALKKREQALDEYAARSNELKMQTAEKDDAIAALQQTIQEQDASLERFRTECETLNGEIENNRLRLEEIQQRIGNLSEERQKMMAEINSKEEQLGMNDVDLLKKKYDEVSKALDEKQEAYAALQKELESGQEEIDRIRSACENLQSEMHTITQTIRQETERNQQLEQNYQTISARQAEIRKKHDEWKELLASLESPDNQANLRICEAETEVLQDAVDKLFPDVDFVGLTLFEKREEADKKRRYFKEEIAKIRHQLEAYKAQYRTLVTGIETGVRT